MADIFDKLSNGDVFDRIAGPVITPEVPAPPPLPPEARFDIPDVTDPYIKKPKTYTDFGKLVKGALARGSMKIGEAALEAPSVLVRQAGWLKKVGLANKVLQEKDPEKKKQWLNLMAKNERIFNGIADELATAANLHREGQRIIQERHPEWEYKAPESFKELLLRPDLAALQVAESLPVLVGSGILTVAGQPQLAVGLMYVTEGQQAKEQALADGRSEDDAAVAYGLYGSVAAVIENMQLKGLLNVSKRSYQAVLNRAVQRAASKNIKNLTGEFLIEAVKQAAEEVSQGTWQELTAKFVYDKEIPGGVKDFIDRRAQEAYTAALMTAIPGGPGTVVSAIKGGKPVVDTTIPTKEVVDTEVPVESPQDINVYKTTEIKPQEGEIGVSGIKDKFVIRKSPDEIRADLKKNRPELTAPQREDIVRKAEVEILSEIEQNVGVGDVLEVKDLSGERAVVRRYVVMEVADGRKILVEIDKNNKTKHTTGSEIVLTGGNLVGPLWQGATKTGKLTMLDGTTIAPIQSPSKPQEPLTQEQQVNVYKTTDNKTKNITEEQLDFDKETGKLTFQGKDVILDTEASGSALQPTPVTENVPPIPERKVMRPEWAPNKLANVKEKGKSGISIERPPVITEGLNDNNRIVVYRNKNGKPIGTIKFELNDKGELEKGIFEDTKEGKNQIEVFVDPGYRRQGIATKMWNYAKKKGYDLSSVSGQLFTEEGEAFTKSLVKQQVKRRPNKRTLLAKGHKIARERGIEKEDYREYAEIVTGKRSMKDMSLKEMGMFVDALEEAFGSPTELTSDDFKKPIVVNGKGTTMDNVFKDAVETLDKLKSRKPKQEIIKRGQRGEGLGTKLKHFFFGIDNTPVYHLAYMLDGGEEGVFSDVLDKNIQRGVKIANGHKRDVHMALIKLLSDSEVTKEDLAKISSYANPRLSILQKASEKFRTETDVVEINKQKFDMTKAELLDIYLMSRQEDGLRHLLKGGLVVNGVKTGAVTEDFVLSIMEQVENDPKLNNIVNAIDTIEKNIWKPSINQTSNRLDGKDIATVKDWWGLEVYMPRRIVGKQEKISRKMPELNLIEDKSILRDRTKSRSPLVVRDALSRFSVFEAAISEYIGMAEPTRISRTLLNDPTLNTVIDQKGYNEIKNRISAIHKRAQSIRQPEGNFSELIARNISGLYRAVLYFNPRVIASQATSEFNYGAYVSSDYLKSLKEVVNVDLARATLDLSDVAWDRFFMGHSSLELGEAAKSDATLRYWTDKSSDANKLGWTLKAADLGALSAGMDVAMKEYEDARTGKIKGLSAEWWTDKTDLSEANFEMWKKVQEQGEQADPVERRAVEAWRQVVTERAEYLWQRTQPSWDKWNRSNLTSQKGLRNIFLLFRSFHEKSLTIVNQAKLDYDNSAKTIEDKAKFAQRTGAVAMSYSVNAVIRAAILSLMARRIKEPIEYIKDIGTAWTGIIPVFGKVLDQSLRNFVNSAFGLRYEYRGEPLESFPIEVVNIVLKTPETFSSAMGDLISGDEEGAKKSFKKGIGDLIEGIGLLYGIPIYEIKRVLPEDEGETTSSKGIYKLER